MTDAKAVGRAIVRVERILEALSPEDALAVLAAFTKAPPQSSPSKNALRQARFRERHRELDVTSDVTSDVMLDGMSGVTVDGTVDVTLCTGSGNSESSKALETTGNDASNGNYSSGFLMFWMPWVWSETFQNKMTLSKQHRAFLELTVT